MFPRAMLQSGIPQTALKCASNARAGGGLFVQVWWGVGVQKFPREQKRESLGMLLSRGPGGHQGAAEA